MFLVGNGAQKNRNFHIEIFVETSRGKDDQRQTLFHHHVLKHQDTEDRKKEENNQN